MKKSIALLGAVSEEIVGIKKAMRIFVYYQKISLRIERIFVKEFIRDSQEILTSQTLGKLALQISQLNPGTTPSPNFGVILGVYDFALFYFSFL